MNARDVMTTNVLTVPESVSLAEAAQVMLDGCVNAMPVVGDHGRLVGMVGLKDVLRAPTPASRPDTLVTRYVPLEARAQALATTQVSKVMSRRIVSVEEETPAEEVLAIMANRGLHPIPVVTKGGLLAGVIGRADIARVLLMLCASPSGAPPRAE